MAPVEILEVVVAPMIFARESEYPIFEVCEFANHEGYWFWNREPLALGTGISAKRIFSGAAKLKHWLLGPFAQRLQTPS